MLYVVFSVVVFVICILNLQLVRYLSVHVLSIINESIL